MTKPAIDWSFSIDGDVELGRAFNRAKARIDVESFAAEAAELVEREARQGAPRLTGALEASVQVETLGDGASVIAGGPGVPYAGVIHFGWSAHGIEATPFLWDALDRKEDAIVGVFADRTDDAISVI